MDGTGGPPLFQAKCMFWPAAGGVGCEWCLFCAATHQEGSQCRLGSHSAVAPAISATALGALTLGVI